MPANLGNSAVAKGLENVIYHPAPKKDNDKECPNYCTIVLISHVSKVMLKILQAMLPDVQAGFRKAEDSETTLPTSTGS